MLFIMPIIQLLIMPLAADYEIKNINISVVDHDRSALSNQLIQKVLASGYFQLSDYNDSYQESIEDIEANRSDLILEIPLNFEQNLYRDGQEKLFVAANAINGVKAGLGGSYMARIISDFNQNIIVSSKNNLRSTAYNQIEIAPLNWFNPYLNYQMFMVPAILAILVTMIGAYMCGLNIVKEKEIGTIEQINVSPIKKHEYILGKLLPFWILGMIIFSIGFLIVARVVYGIVPLGSLFLLYGYLALYLVAILGFGLLISTYADTQQQSMSISFFFMMIFILMSGLFTSIDAMPDWAQKIAYANPVTYFVQVMRMIVLKGSEFRHIMPHIIITIAFAILFNTWAIVNYKKTN